ncbi:chaplin [Streptomyces sp. NPDC057555]|uniref:chaplin n=1 Tax=Streptomyces sp. NPDC057555 TaxID=3346166 RepID=UPI00369F84D9
MRQVARKGLITMAAAGGVLAMATGYAHADATAAGGASHSPGVVSGNAVQVPVNVPINACGNTVDVVGLLNPAFGNNCANVSGGRHGHGHHGGDGRGHDQGGNHRQTSGGHGGATAAGGASHSPGVGSGNAVQAPIDVPVNACGNSIDVDGLLNPTFGNDCANVSPTSPDYPHRPGHPREQGHHPDRPGSPHEPRSVMPKTPGVRTQTAGAPHARVVTTARHGERQQPQLAQTGGGALGFAVPLSAGMLVGGAVLYRRARTARR